MVALSTSSTSAVAQAQRPRALGVVGDLVRAHPLAAYFAVAYLGSWLAISPLLLGASGFGLLPVALPEVLSVLIYLFVATFVGPTLAAFVVSGIEGGRPGIRRFAAGYARWRVAPQWWLIAPLAFPTLWLLGYSAVLGGAPLLNLARNPLVLVTVFLPALILIHFLPALGEEAGWRGFALPRLQAWLGPVRGTIVLGLLHGLWHLPAFFVTGLLGPFTVSGFAAFLVTAVAGAFIFTWVVNRALGSILIATLVHAGSNAATNLLLGLLPGVPPDEGVVGWLLRENRLNVLIFGLAALALVAATRGRLGYRPAAASAGGWQP